MFTTFLPCLDKIGPVSLCVSLSVEEGGLCRPGTDLYGVPLGKSNQCLEVRQNALITYKNILIL